MNLPSCNDAGALGASDDGTANWWARKREEEMGESMEVSGLVRKTRVERDWIDLGFHQTARAGRREIFFLGSRHLYAF